MLFRQHSVTGYQIQSMVIPMMAAKHQDTRLKAVRYPEGKLVIDVPTSSIFYGKLRPGDIIRMIGDKRVEYTSVPDDFKDHLQEDVIKLSVFCHTGLSTQSIFDLYKMKVMHGPMVGENDCQTQVKYRFSSGRKESNIQVAPRVQKFKRPMLQASSSPVGKEKSPSNSENEFDPDFEESMQESLEVDCHGESESAEESPTTIQITKSDMQESNKYRDLARDVLKRVPDEDLKEMNVLDIGE